MRQKPPSQPTSYDDKPMFVTWNSESSKNLAIAQLSNAIRGAEPVMRTSASLNTHRNIGGSGISAREGYGRGDYDNLRPELSLPRTIADAIRASDDAYDNHGIVHNIFDMICDFTVQGVELFHPNERIQDFYRNWFKKVRGVERSERFVALVCRHANIVIQRSTAKINVARENQMRAEGADLDVTDNVRYVKREIPWRYTFLNPLSLCLVSEELCTLAGRDGYIFKLKIPKQIKTTVLKSKKTAEEKAVVDMLPDGIVEALKRNEDSIILPPEKIRTFFYRKDDWDVWAKPLLTPIIKDLQLLERMKLADMSALDGAISCIRVWRLGSLEHKFMPTPAAFAKLSEMLTNNIGGGVMDLVWDCAIDLLETSTEVHKFLGETKYASTISQILAGLGVPPTLAGFASEGGMTNNALSLKTLIERMNYIRELLVEFWNEEIRIVQKAMGFRFPATIRFKRMTLMDEQQERALAIQLLDRMGYSLESIQEVYGLDPEIEEVRLRREERKRQRGWISRKAGPFHTDTMHEMKKLLATTKTYTPTQLGLDIPERKPGEESPAEIATKLSVKLAKAKPKESSLGTPEKPAGQPGQGRPLNSKDSTKRKRKDVKPRTKASEAFMDAFAWAEYAQGFIADTTSSAYLNSLGKKSMRELTTAESKAFEEFKFNALFNVTPFVSLAQEELETVIENPLTVPEQVTKLLELTIANYVKTHKAQPPMEMVRRFQSGVFACWAGDYSEVDDEAENIEL